MSTTRETAEKIAREQAHRLNGMQLMVLADAIDAALTKAIADERELRYQVELNHERLITAVQMALQGLHERCSQVAALQWFQSEYNFAVNKVKDADESTVFALRRGLPTLTGNAIRRDNTADTEVNRPCWASTIREQCIDPGACDDRGCQLYAED